MKRFLLIVFILLSCFLFSCGQDGNAVDKNKQEATNKAPDNNKEFTSVERKTINYSYIKGIWLSQFDLQNIYSNNGNQREETDYSEKISLIISNIKNMGFNTVILQIRPNCDSFYPSEIYPPSKYVTGSYEKEFIYDPVKIFVEKAHEQNLSVQAWVNPYRCMRQDEIQQIDDKYKIKQWYNEKSKNIVLHEGYYYLDPYYKDNQNLITGGIKEILNNYAFDGIHIDDYFYPTPSEDFDKQSYTEYLQNGRVSDLQKYRLENVNQLISGIYSIVKEIDNNLIFGVSPSGNISRTYNETFADIYTWCSNQGYIDYISPQIYFGLQHQTHPFDKVIKEWADIIKLDNIKLVAGITLEKAYKKVDVWAGSGSNEWALSNDIIRRCIQSSLNIDKCSGLSFFSYQFFFNPTSNNRIKETYNEIENFMPLFTSIPQY